MASSPPASDDDRYQDDLWKQPTHARILVSDAEAGIVIGRGGSSIAAVQSNSGANVQLSRRGQLLPGTDSRVLLVSGLFHQVMDAAELILQKIIFQGDQVIDDRAAVVLVVPEACCGALIGKGGTVIRSLAIASKAGILVSPHDICYGLEERLVTITGHLDNQLQAIFLILSELLEDDRYSCSYTGVPFPYPASSVGCEDHGRDEHVEIYQSRSPPSLCMWYRWIDTEQSEWALREIEQRSRRAWESFYEDERREKAAEERRAEQEEQRRQLEELRRQREEQRRLR
uniref:Uncharacterized protein n=1 Tax=Avena sativa TaxID=4498 RepID=A0ACD5W7C8_AVESA